MHLAELSTRSGVPIPTIKYYRREGLLPAGEGAGAGRAEYGEHHLARLRLVRALVAVGGLPISRVREVVASVEDPGQSTAEAMGSAHRRLSPPVPEPSRASRERVAALVAERGWSVDPDGPHGLAAAAALDAMDDAESSMTAEALAAYGRAAEAVGEVDLRGLGDLAREPAVERAVTGTVLGEPVLLALRRLAQEAWARR